MKASYPLPAPDVAAVITALGVAVPPLRARRVHARRARHRGGGAERRPDGRRGAQATGALHGRRLPRRALRGTHGSGLEADDRRRVGGSGTGDRDGPRARPRLPSQREHGPRAQGDRRLRRAALRGHRRRHELGQVPRGRAGRGRRVAHGRRPGRCHASRRRARRTTGRLEPEPMERTVKAIAGMADEARQDGAEAIAAVGTAGLRLASNSARLRSTPCENAAASRSRSSRATTRPASPTSLRPRGWESAAVRGSCSTRAAAARSSRSGTESTSTSGSA